VGQSRTRASRRWRCHSPNNGLTTAELAERWERTASSTGSLDVAREMSSLALTIIVRSMFSQSGRYDDLRSAVHQIQERLAARFWSLSSLFAANRYFRHALRTLDTAVDTIIAARQTSETLDDDLLGQLLGARDPESGETLDRTALGDEVMTMFLAGHETWGRFKIRDYAELDINTFMPSSG
jgi:cytochrome P450